MKQRRTHLDKLMAKRLVLVRRTALALGTSEAEATELLRLDRRQSLRINPLRTTVPRALEELRQAGWRGKEVSWMPQGYTIDCPLEVVRDSAAVQAGRVFIQNAASWLPVLALNPQSGAAVLDVCAAPGGKASHLAALTNNASLMVANDNSRSRLGKMLGTFARLGVSNVETTLFDATQLARKLEGRQFEYILLDAPCSGEGLMNLDDTSALGRWSVAQIKRLQQLQKRLINQAWQLLRPGGTLVYSTCTMAPEENEAVIDYLLRTRTEAEAVPLEFDLPNRIACVQAWNNKTFAKASGECLRLKPSPEMEAFFVAKIMKRL